MQGLDVILTRKYPDTQGFRISIHFHWHMSICEAHTSIDQFVELARSQFSRLQTAGGEAQ
jgi:hypothetical protein